ncbi:MAG: hypothetical protein IK121_03200, partial [Lachnospiraceae bacterium]|nr:hypothetical protein [Lachnospiraceae bacterium]
MSQCATSAGKKEEKLSEKNNDPNKKRRILGRCFLAVGVFLCLFAAFLFVFKVTQKTTEFHVELGTKVSNDISDYISGKDFSLKISRLDLSKVDEETVGTYEASVRFLYKKFTYEIIIEDTTAPEVLFNTGSYVCEKDADVDLRSFVDRVIDESEVSYSYINVNEDETITRNCDNTLVFSDNGIHPLFMRVTDAYGNSSDYYMPVRVDTAPYLYGTLDYYVAVGSEIDITSDVHAKDEVDGDLSSKVEGRVSAAYTKYPGDYVITYNVTDSYGLTATTKGLIHTYDPLMIQDMVNTKKLDPFALNVAGVINPYDCGYIEESNMDAAIDNIKHAVVRIHYETPRTRTFGSGYIVKITDKEIICATNNHVVTDRNYVTVSFYDGTNVEARVVAGKVSPDIAFISINRSDIEDFDNLDLKTIHINRGYYESLSSKPQFEMGMYCINENGSQWLERTGKIVRKSGKLDKYFENYDYAVTQISV